MERLSTYSNSFLEEKEENFMNSWDQLQELQVTAQSR